MPQATLEDIRIKVRRLVRAPSNAQIEDDEITEYINTFMLFDMPASVQLPSFRRSVRFFTEPHRDTYPTGNEVSGDTLFDFKNKYTGVHRPLYVNGVELAFSTSQSEFYRWYPTVRYREEFATGDGTQTSFSTTFSRTPVLRETISVASVSNSVSRVLHDDGAGALMGSGTGTVNYETGAITANFSVAPDAGETVAVTAYPYTASRPHAVLYFNNAFVLRPVPDAAYQIDFTATVRPTMFDADDDMEPILQQWWQYIAYGAAKKIFEDRMDTESITRIMPEMRNQERLALRRAIVQQKQERVSTIYSGGEYHGPGWFGADTWY